MIAVTSASPGDGKTSLTLALGLSYAACGARTLLIDCDLVGAGLTARLDVAAPEGILEAVARRSLLPFVRATDLPDVRILPVGTSQSRQASTLSPAALRRLLEEARAISTPSSSTPARCWAASRRRWPAGPPTRVVLAVSRGQERPAVQKSLKHLAAIGRALAGVVFNRAEPTDLARSLSSPKPRQSPAMETGSTRFPFGIGPLAGAVRCTPGGADDR